METRKIGRRMTLNGISDQQCVYCKKNINGFKKGNWYILVGVYGNPQASYYNGDNFMTTTYLNCLTLMDDKGNKELFDWEGKLPHMVQYATIGFFQEHFYLTDKEVRRDKLKKLKHGV